MKCLALIFATICGVDAAALSPAEEQASFRLADDSLTVELVAAEPNVVSPVAIAWDAAGRLFVAEMIDYPLGPAAGRVRMLADADGNGTFENATVFADQLAFPNGVLPWRDGILVTAAPNILFLRDADGDGRADERRVILTGFAEGNQQLRVNGLHWGMDGWVYGANGRSDGELRRPGEARSVSLRGHDFRFNPDTGEFAAIAGRSQFGTPRDDWGNRFLSWNTIAIRQEIIPERFLARNPNIPLTEAVRDLAPEGDKGEVFPLTPAPRTFNNESTSHFNALAGLMIYRGDALPGRYYGNAFMGETLRNLVHRRALEPAGTSFIARRVEEGKEFLASTDPWFHPVNFATGPDGALYIVDFYRQWVEHPGYVPEKFRDKVAWRTGAEHGRIWRVRPREWKRRGQPFADALRKNPMQFLSEPNAWWRDTAARLLLENPALADSEGLGKRVDGSSGADVREQAQALYLLSQLGRLDAGTFTRALRSQFPALREAAVRVAENHVAFSGMAAELVDDSDPAVRLRAALIAGAAERDVRIKSLSRLAARPDLDHATAVAIRSSSFEISWDLVQALPEAAASETFYELVRWLASDTAVRHDPSELNRLQEYLTGSGEPGARRLAVFAGVCRALPKGDEGDEVRTRLLSNRSAAERYILAARKTLESPGADGLARENAVEVLALLAAFESSPSVLRFLAPGVHQRIQTAAAQAMAASANTNLWSQAFDGWSQYTLATRRQLAAGAVRSPENSTPLISALRTGRISPLELDPSQRAAILRLTAGEENAAMEKLFGPPQSRDRVAVVEKYADALKLSGDRERGRLVFEKTCAPCHAVAGGGGQVGPNLSAIASRSKESLLVDIFDPNRQVNPEFVNYSIELTNDESLNGLIVSENDATVTIRRPNLPDDPIARTRIRTVQASALSLMPEGFESSLTSQDVADLFVFLTGN